MAWDLIVLQVRVGFVCFRSGLHVRASTPQMRDDLVSNLVSALRGGKDDKKKNPIVPTQAVRGDTQNYRESGLPGRLDGVGLDRASSSRGICLL